MAVVCLHGLGRTRADWDGVRPGLERFGTVSMPALPREGAQALRIARGVIAPGDTVIGHSMGAIVALRAAAVVPVAAVVLSAGFYPPARNGRTALRSLADYGEHRLALARDLVRHPRERAPGGGRAGALASLARMAARPGGFAAVAGAVDAPVLVLHARDDHYVPVDFALAAAARHPAWRVALLDAGGHHAHVTEPAAWLAPVTAFLAA